MRTFLHNNKYLGYMTQFTATQGLVWPDWKWTIVVAFDEDYVIALVHSSRPHFLEIHGPPRSALCTLEKQKFSSLTAFFSDFHIRQLSLHVYAAGEHRVFVRPSTSYTKTIEILPKQLVTFSTLRSNQNMIWYHILSTWLFRGPCNCWDHNCKVCSLRSVSASTCYSKY